MNEIALAAGLVALLAFYLTAVAWYAIFIDDSLSNFQRAVQALLSFVIPILGPLAALYFAHPLPKHVDRLIPWPFRSFVADKPMRKGVGNEEFIDNENHFNP